MSTTTVIICGVAIPWIGGVLLVWAMCNAARDADNAQEAYLREQALGAKESCQVLRCVHTPSRAPL